MEKYTIKKCNDTFCWEDIPVLNIDSLLLPTEADVSAWGQLYYDDNAIYVKLSARETEIRAELTGALDPICEDSCLEFFFCPMENDIHYFNIECNLNGAIYLGFATNVHDLVRLIPEEPEIIPFAKRTQDGWEVEYKIPYSFIKRFFPNFNVFSGKKIRANAYKCGDSTHIPHYLCWQQVPLLEEASFHNPTAFGEMIFE